MKNYHLLILLCISSLASNAQLVKDYVEKVYLHVDRDIYNLGEDIFYKAYIVDAYSLKPQVLSKVLYVDLLDSKQNLIEHQKLKIEDGAAFGKFSLNDELNNGHYYIRSYTNWMRNWEPTAFFTKLIFIRSPFVDQQKSTTLSNVTNDNSLEVLLNHEGGPLVHGVLSKVCIQALQQGSPVKISNINLIDENDKVVQSLDQDFFGRGILSFVPDKSSNYQVSFLCEGQRLVYPLPQIQHSGVVITSLGETLQNLTFKVATSQNALQRVTLQVKYRDSSFVSSAFSFYSESLFSIAKDDIPFGPNEIVISDSLGNELSTLFFLNRPTTYETIAVQIEESLKGTEILKVNGIDSANISVAIIDVSDSLLMKNRKTIQSELLLESELEGYIHAPQHFFNGTVTDLRVFLATTHGAHWHRWNKPQQIDFGLELGLFVQGKVANHKKTGETLINLIYPDNRLQSTPLGEDGAFAFMINDYVGNGEFTVHSASKKAKLSLIDNSNVDTRSFSFLEEQRLETFIQVPQLPEHEIEWNENVIILDEITLETKAQTREAYKEFKRRFFGEPALSIDVADITQRHSFPDLFSLLAGRLIGFRIVNADPFDQTGQSFRIVSTRGTRSIQIPGEIQIYLNGALVDPTIITTIDPNQVDFIDLYQPTRSYIFGGRGGNGVISIYTKTGPEFDPELESTRLKSDILKFNWEGYTPYLSSNPTGNFESSGATIYWNPQVTQNESLKIPALSPESSYKLIIEGVSKHGQLIYQSIDITSKNL